MRACTCVSGAPTETWHKVAIMVNRDEKQRGATWREVAVDSMDFDSSFVVGRAINSFVVELTWGTSISTRFGFE